MDSKDTLPQQLMELMREHAKNDKEYVNPFFLMEISNLLESYYKLEDDDVDSWIRNMFER